LAGFVQSLSATWRILLLRFALAFVVLAIAWWALAPAYAQLLAMLGRPLIPVLEHVPGTTYWVEDATVWTTRSLFDPATQRPQVFKVELWKGYASYDLILLAALILATPGWSLRQRGRLLGLGLVLITLTEFAFFLSTIEYSQLRPLPSQTGSVLIPAGFSRPKQILFTWVYYFFQTMGRGLFPLLIYWGMLGLTWSPPGKAARTRAVVTAPGRNAPCPCGSGKKYKHCCGKR
jgi:SEC-C motif-containing protein